jgi:hypothetical protein
MSLRYLMLEHFVMDEVVMMVVVVEIGRRR